MKPKEIFRAMAEKKTVLAITNSRKITGIIISMNMSMSKVRDNKSGKIIAVKNTDIQPDTSEIEIIDYPKYCHLQSILLRKARDLKVIKKENGLVLIEYKAYNSNTPDTVWLAECRIRRKK